MEGSITKDDNSTLVLKSKDIIINRDYINERINNEVCCETIEKLADNKLLNDYKECESVKNAITKLQEILEKHNILLREFGNRGPLVYIIKVKSYNDNTYII